MIHLEDFYSLFETVIKSCPDDPKRRVKVLWSYRDYEINCLDDVLLLEDIA